MPRVGKQVKAARYEKFIDQLMVSSTRKQAIQNAGISSATADRWLRDPEFLTLLSARRDQLSEHLRDRAVTLLQASLEALGRNMQCGLPSIEVRAATAAADISIKYFERHDLALRLDLLETTLDVT